MATIQMVCKPLSPPWNDSSKNLPRELVLAAKRHRFRIPVASSISSWPSYVSATQYRSPKTQMAALAAQLAVERTSDLWHFFFAPNVRSSSISKWLSKMRGVRTLHTLCSLPAHDVQVVPLLFADINVVLSRRSETRLLENGCAKERIRRIAPGVSPLSPLEPERRTQLRSMWNLSESEPLAVYPGDLEFSSGAQISLTAFAEAVPRGALAMVCRAKTSRARQREQELRQLAQQLKISHRVLWIGETPAIHDWLGAADVVLLPADSLFAKMDYPLVAIEAMLLETPVMVGAGTAAEELAGEGVIATPVHVEAVAATLRRILNDSEFRFKAGKESRERALRDFSPHHMAQQYERLYEEVLS